LNAFKIQLISVVDDDPSVIEGIVRLIESVGYASMGCFSAADFLTSAPVAPHGASDSGRAYAGDPARPWGESASTMQMIRVSLFK
jgi:CheY-like chemotaxis protein